MLNNLTSIILEEKKIFTIYLIAITMYKHSKSHDHIPSSTQKDLNKKLCPCHTCITPLPLELNQIKMLLHPQLTFYSLQNIFDLCNLHHELNTKT